MNKVTIILNAIEEGDPEAINTLLPAVYKELRQMANHKLIRLYPTCPMFSGMLVCWQAGCPLAKYRDGEKALINATKTIELCKQYNIQFVEQWMCLADAYATLGDYDSASLWSERAVEGLPDRPTRCGH